MMKKLLYIIALLTLCLLFYAASAETSGDYTYSVSSGKATITGYTGTATTLSIPATIDGLPVTAIGNYAFENNGSLTRVTIPASVTEIGREAFRSCDALASVTLNEGLATIGYQAFADLPLLTSMTVPNSVTSLGNSFIAGDLAITYLKLGGGIKTPSRQQLHLTWYYTDVSALKTVVFSEGVTSIPGYAFSHYDSSNSSSDSNNGNYPSLSSVTLPTTLTAIGEHAFQNCDALPEITIPGNVTTIGDYAFQDCDLLPEITIPSKVKTIGSYAFQDCDLLPKITIPASVTEIGSEAFRSCDALASVTLNEGLTTIGYSAFAEHHGL